MQPVGLTGQVRCLTFHANKRFAFSVSVRKSRNMSDVRLATLHAALRGMLAIGLPPASLEQVTGLSKAAAQASFAPSRHWDRLWAWATKHDADPLLAARVALAVPSGAFGALDYFVATAPTLHVALQSLQYIFPAISDGTRILLAQTDDGLCRLRLFLPIEGVPYKALFTLGVLLARFLAATNGSFEPQRIYVTQGLKTRAACQRLFGAPIVCSAARPGFDFGAKRAHQPLATADASLHAALQAQLRATFFRQDDAACSQGLTYAVAERLWLQLGRTACDLSATAASFGLSPRTLLRRLEAEHTTYKALLCRVRVDLGQTLMAEGVLPLSAIAQRLGYAEQSAWTRAFRSSVGVAPSVWRQRALMHRSS